MPRVDNPNALKNSLPGMLGTVKAITDDIKSSSPHAMTAQTGVTGVLNNVFTTTDTQLTSLSFTMPAGFTQALVVSNVVAVGNNNGSSGDYLYASVHIDPGGWFSGYTPQYAPAGISASTALPFYVQLTGLTSGQVITVAAHAWTFNHAWTITTGNANAVNLYALVQFLK